MESTTINNAIKKVRELFDELRSNVSREETKRIRNKLYKKEAIYNFLKEKDSLTDKEKFVLKNIGKYLKKLNNDLKKLYKYQDNVMYGLDYLFDEVNEKDYYEPKEIKSTFDGNYVLYKSKGDKDAKLALWEYFDKIKPHLKEMVDDYKSKLEWKIQITMRIILISFIDKNETQVMHTNSDNVEIMNGTATNDAINELIDSFMKRYKKRPETKMKETATYLNILIY